MKYIIQALRWNEGVFEQHHAATLDEANVKAMAIVRETNADLARIWEDAGVEHEAMRDVAVVTRAMVCPEEFDTPVDPRADFEGDWNGHAW